MKHELVITADGSSSIFIETFDEHYHSVHGALQESKHVFIEAGLYQKINKKENISVLEIGFGTGLNALLTCLEAEGHHQKINYTTIEKFPLQLEIYSQLNYCKILENKNCDNLFNIIHSCNWEINTEITSYFQLLKLQQDIENCNFNEQFDIVYFDAFAPSSQPELWTETIFEAMYNALNKDGILVTYCAKGVVKRAMKTAGFIVEALPGPIGKREMTRAQKL